MEKSRHKKVLHVSHNMDIGGAEQVIKHLILNLPKTPSMVVCIDGRVGPIGNSLIEHGVSVKCIPRGNGLDLTTIGELRKLIKSNDIEIVHCHQYTPFCYGALATLGMKVKLIFTEHGRFHPDNYTWKRRFSNQVLYRLADEIVAISKSTRSALAQYEWIPEKKTRVIYNGIPELRSLYSVAQSRDLIGLEKSGLVVGTIARLDPIKNQELIVYAFSRFLKDYQDSTLLIVGDGPERGKLEKIVAELGISESVIFSGFISDVSKYLQAIDIFLLTSFSEGTSITLLEAMSYGKAIVATNVGGNVELISDNDCGLLIPSNDLNALHNRLLSLANSETTRTEFGERAKAAFEERFSLFGMLDAYQLIYET